VALLRREDLSLPKSAKGTARPVVKVKRLAHAAGLALPRYQSEGAAGLDLVASVDARKDLAIKPGRFKLVPTGLTLEIPSGFEGQVRPRSGLAAKHGLTVLNSPGTIDSDYRGEVMVLLVNLGAEKVRIRRGERIAQLVIAPVIQASLVETDALGSSKRGTGGFGSTGTRARPSAIRGKPASKRTR
jgi:dUTP pyrophosphatase